jgi:uracil-DNA glycosylase
VSAMTELPGSRDELSALVAAFRARLAWARRQGAGWVGGAASPRFGVTVEPGPPPAPVGRVEPHPAEPPSATATLVEDAPPVEDGAAATPVEDGAAEDAPVDRALRLKRLREELGACRRCRLGDTRQHLVFGVGSAEAGVLFIGEAPGRDEDLQGEPFVGAAGQLLTKMIEAMGLRREDVYIANIIKCRPPDNRDPAPDEIGACEPFLRAQVEIIAPRLIVALGNHAAKTLLRTDVGITRLRGRFHAYQGIPLMPTFHPAYLLRNPEEKRAAWQDLKMVMAEMDRLGLARRRT